MFFFRAVIGLFIALLVLGTAFDVITRQMSKSKSRNILIEMQLLKPAKIENVLQSRGLNKTLAGDCCLAPTQQYFNYIMARST
jgi:hypothetical protein